METDIPAHNQKPEMTTTTDTPRTDACLNTHSMVNHQKWCHKCGGFVEGIYASPMSCRCDPKADRIKELEAEVERLNRLLCDLLILTEKQYWNSNN